ncbi:MAG: radical SAM protein [Deltaproteobacteria bacterium]|nr:radical SAM protein [Deltaproteobacteria bacterium]
MTKRCDLHCVHCYSDSANRLYSGELTTQEGKALIDSFASFRAPVIIFSGGDPLLRDDLFELASYARDKGVRPILSTSGIHITPQVAVRIKQTGITYVGVSLDGGEEVNDKLRGMKGAYNKAVEGLRHCRDAGLIAGIRFTMSKKTVGQLPAIFDLLEKENIKRGYFAHLVYSGRGQKFSREDLDHNETRQAVDYIFDKAGSFVADGKAKDIVTGSNDVDGVYLYLKLKETDPQRAEDLHKLLIGRGGNSSGVTLANIDNLGNVHPDQFWQHYSLGNVRDRDFGEIWMDRSDPVMNILKDRRAAIKGRCALCPHFDICGANYRVRAEFVTDDLWAEDPACYLTDEELGITAN